MAASLRSVRCCSSMVRIPGRHHNVAPAFARDGCRGPGVALGDYLADLRGMDTVADFARTGSEHLDVLIVGAGLSGIGAAWHLQDKCPAKSYAIVEARE